eukprot:g21333.t1
MLAAMSPSGSLHAFDMDPEAIAVGKELMQADSRFTIHHAPFSSMKAVLKPLGVKPSGVLFDLGISSPQFDDAGRGFHVLCLARAREALPQRTREFAMLVAQGKGPEYQAMHPAKLTFQALRIHLNNEFGEMRSGIHAAFSLLNEGGRIGLISWKHSECAIIMDIFRSLEAVRDKEIEVLQRLTGHSCFVRPGAPSKVVQCTSCGTTSREVVHGDGRDGLWPQVLAHDVKMDSIGSTDVNLAGLGIRELQTNSRSRSALLHVLRKRRMPRLADLEQLAYALPAWCSVTEPSSSSVPKKRRKVSPAEAQSSGAPLVVADGIETRWPCGRCGVRGHRSGPEVAGVASRSQQMCLLRLSECPMSHMDGCNHCGQAGHTTKFCTFGSKPLERFLFCEAVRPHLPCFWRRFLVPLQRADADAFKAEDPRTSGRADVGLRCLSAALFRSQGVRHNTQACLSFEKSGHTLEVSGALVRGLVPDEPHLAERVRLALNGEPMPDPSQEPEAWCTSPLRGMEARKRSTKAALKAGFSSIAVTPCDGHAALRKADESPGRVVMLLLDADGEPIAEVLKQVRRGGAVQGLVVLVGDHRGFTGEDMEKYEKVALSSGADVIRASLGGTTLLGSHAIVILQHYLDEHMHRCEDPQSLILSLRLQLEEAQTALAEASAALTEGKGSALGNSSELHMQLAEALGERERLTNELGKEQALRKQAIDELERRKAMPLPAEKERRILAAPPAESQLLRTEYKAEIAAAKRYRAASRQPPAPPEPTSLQRAEAAAARGMWRLEQKEASRSSKPSRPRPE